MSLLLMLLAAWQSAGAPAFCQARLETHAQDGLLTVTGHCRNLATNAGHYRYELSMRRESNGNFSQNTQRGEFIAAPQEEVTLSQTRLNAGPHDNYQIYLRVFDLEGHTLAQDSLIQAPIR